jgi:8-oxo-dGTP pyrophosphatase MutT (NUDIX family)
MQAVIFATSRMNLPIYRAQVGALPVRGKAGAYEVLLVTSRESGRWIIPKGWPMRGKKDHEAARHRNRQLQRPEEGADH